MRDSFKAVAAELYLPWKRLWQILKEHHLWYEKDLRTNDWLVHKEQVYKVLQTRPKVAYLTDWRAYKVVDGFVPKKKKRQTRRKLLKTRSLSHSPGTTLIS